MDEKQNNGTIFIVGLGNPGENYYNTPHSLGFMVVDEFARRFGFPAFSMPARSNALVSAGSVAGKQVILVKPQAFMNRSGMAVQRAIKDRFPGKFKDFQNLWIVNDDLDIPFCKIRIARNRGPAGHKGVQSVIDQLKTKNFVRFRLGIQKPEVASKKITPERYVLKKFSGADMPAVEEIVQKTAAALETALREGLDKAMTEYNK